MDEKHRQRSMIFKPMKPEAVRNALKGHEDILRSAFETHEKYFKSLHCPECRGEVLAIVNARTPFREGSLTPNYLAKCKICGAEFEPYTGIQVTLPEP
jgi:RNase P subunit RPR2